MTAKVATFRAKPQHGSAWVTGASSGLGRDVALALARRGFTIHATARRAEALDALAAASAGLSGRIVAAPGDVTAGGVRCRDYSCHGLTNKPMRPATPLVCAGG